ncbi:MAG TPA: flavin reductase [Chloroflexota bacterium]|nr:flavin reductase [Chloroflexota bacterium]
MNVSAPTHANVDLRWPNTEVGKGPPVPADPLEFRRTMGLFATGVTVVTVRDGEAIHGMTANAVTSVSLDPLLVLVCVDSRAHMRELLPRVGRFAINMLGEDQQPLSRQFSGRAAQKGSVTFSSIDDVPTLPECLATLICTVDRLVDAGDHVVVFGRVDTVARSTVGGRPLVYYAGDYQRLALSARLRRMEREQQARHEALRRIAECMAASEDVEDVFDAFAQGMSALIAHDAVTVTLLREDGRLERFALAAVDRIGPRLGEFQDIDQSAAGLAVRTGSTVWTANMAADPRFLGANDRRWIAEGFHSFISAPLRTRGRVIGALNVLCREPDRYAVPDIALVEAIAGQIAVFLNNMDLHARLRDLLADQERRCQERAALTGPPTC